MEFLSYLINGVSLGSIYAIIALGYTMVYGIAKMLNFAHGDVIMVGGLCVLLHHFLRREQPAGGEPLRSGLRRGHPGCRCWLPWRCARCWA